jgi:hypothetical protein
MEVGMGTDLDLELIEPVGGVPEIFVNGFAGYDVTTGILSCSGFRFQKTNGRLFGLVNHKIVMPMDGLQNSIMRAMTAAAIYGFDVHSLPSIRRSLS